MECWKKLINYLTNSEALETIRLGTPPGREYDAKIAASPYIDKL